MLHCTCRFLYHAAAGLHVVNDGPPNLGHEGQKQFQDEKDWWWDHGQFTDVFRFAKIGYRVATDGESVTVLFVKAAPEANQQAAVIGPEKHADPFAPPPIRDWVRGTCPPAVTPSTRVLGLDPGGVHSCGAYPTSGTDSAVSQACQVNHSSCCLHFCLHGCDVQTWDNSVYAQYGARSTAPHTHLTISSSRTPNYDMLQTAELNSVTHSNISDIIV